LGAWKSTFICRQLISQILEIYTHNGMLALATPAEDHYEEIYAEGEELLGNYPDNDFCVELTTQSGNPVFIRPMDARNLRHAAEAGLKRKALPLLAVIETNGNVGLLDLQQVVERLQGY
jgi:hypothetical protein